MGRFAYLVLYFEPLVTNVDSSKLDPPQALSMLASISKVYSNITNSAGFIVANETANASFSSLKTLSEPLEKMSQLAMTT